jgi:protocatechuate 3,4-dioxygenase beta subunit
MGKVPADGSLTLPELAEGEIKLQLYSKQESAKYKPRIPKDLVVHAGDTTKAVVKMEETVLVKGRVLTKPNAKPVVGARISVAYGTFRQSDSVFTDANGEYSARVLPGKVRRQLIVAPEPFRQWIVEESSWANQIEVLAGGGSFDLPPLEMIETVTMSGTLLDFDGDPLKGVRVNALANSRRYGGGTSDKDGVFKIRLPIGMKVENYELNDPERGIYAEAQIVSPSPLVVKHQ